MNAFIALFFATLAFSAQAGYVPSLWPVSTYGSDSWNGLNSRNRWSYPVGVNQWSSAAWPVTYSNSYNGWYGLGGNTVVQANVAKVNPWGLPLASSYGYGYNNYQGVIPAAKYVATNPKSVHLAPLVGNAINQKLIVA